jgi:hypothetical protein
MPSRTEPAESKFATQMTLVNLNQLVGDSATQLGRLHLYTKSSRLHRLLHSTYFRVPDRPHCDTPEKQSTEVVRELKGARDTQ